MEDLLLRNRMNMPVTTGIPATPQTHSARQAGKDQNGPSFQQVLEQKVRTQDVSFSKHAAARVAKRDIELTQAGLEKLNEGVRIAREKGMDDALILVDGSAFIVSAKNGRVITALGGSEAGGKAITNISGAVIL